MGDLELQGTVNIFKCFKLLALGPCATVGLELLSPICEGVRAHVSYRVSLEMTLVTEY